MAANEITTEEITTEETKNDKNGPKEENKNNKEDHKEENKNNTEEPKEENENCTKGPKEEEKKLQGGRTRKSSKKSKAGYQRSFSMFDTNEPDDEDVVEVEEKEGKKNRSSKASSLKKQIVRRMSKHSLSFSSGEVMLPSPLVEAEPQNPPLKDIIENREEGENKRGMCINPSSFFLFIKDNLLSVSV